MLWICLAVQGEEQLPWRHGCGQLPTVKRMSTPELFSFLGWRAEKSQRHLSTVMFGSCKKATSPESTPSTAVPLAKTSAQPATAEERASKGLNQGSGTICCDSLRNAVPESFSLRTWTVPRGASGCPTCGETCGESGIPACQFECKPLTLERPTKVPESLLPRPTATANQLSPSMRKWRSCRHLQDLVGSIGGSPQPTLWEWMMGYRSGWTVVEPWAMPGSPPKPKRRSGA